MRTQSKHYLALLCMIFLLSSCAQFGKPMHDPEVSVTGFKVLPSNNMNLQFEIELHITNPNDFDLDVRGIAYSVEVEGQKIITGVANNLPIIKAYGEEDVRLQAQASLFRSMGLIADLITSKKEQFNYVLEARLDVGALFPDIKVSRSGDIAIPLRHR